MKYYCFCCVIVAALLSGCTTTKEPGDFDAAAFQGPTASSRADTIVGKMLSR